MKLKINHVYIALYQCVVQQHSFARPIRWQASEKNNNFTMHKYIQIEMNYSGRN